MNTDDTSLSTSSFDVTSSVDAALAHAIERGASDLILQPWAHEAQVLMSLHANTTVLHTHSLESHRQWVARIKTLAGMDGAQSRYPQDGTLRWQVATGAVDIRIATLPTHYGERVALRLLHAQAHPWTLSTLGMSQEALLTVERSLKHRSGLWISAGPTGCGKTTTLYALIQHMALSHEKIVTVEDPVEYDMAGVQQLAVNESIGLTFAHALRAWLRHDVDVILIGETRDSETARIGVQAALTGHRVLTSLHTADTLESMARMLSLGVEPLMLAEVLRLVMAQRLVKRADGTGRVAIFEILVASERLSSAMHQSMNSDQLRSLQLLTSTLRDDAQRWLQQGTIQENALLAVL